MDPTPDNRTQNEVPTDREQLAAFGRELGFMAKTLGRASLEHPSSETMGALAHAAIAQAAADVARASMLLESVFGTIRTVRP